MTETKECGDCGKTKPLTEFHLRTRRRDGRQSFCKDCANERARAWRTKRGPGYYQERLQRNPNYFRAQKLRKLYGLTIEQYEQMWERQAGACAICGKSETRKTRGGKPARLNVDHNHTTGLVRGLLCRDCNIALAYLERPDWVRSANTYLMGTPLTEGRRPPALNSSMKGG